jgi:phage terminase large subunit
MRCRDREVLMAGPSGTGKSMGCLQKIDLAASQTPIRAAIVRKLRTALTQAAMVTLREKVLPPPPNAIWFHHEDQEFRYPNGSRVVVAGLDDPRKILSTDFDMIYVQEATELEEQDYLILLTRLRNNALSYQQLIADCNPSYPNHWLKQRADAGLLTMLESRHEDNPQLYDVETQTYTRFGEQYMKTLDSLHGYLHQRLRLGLWVAAEGMFFPEWNPDLHLVDLDDDLPSDWPRWVSVDYGFAVPFCALWFARDPETREIWVYREVYATGMRDEQQADAIKERCGNERILQIVVDPSMFNSRTEQRRPSIAQVYADRGLARVTSQGIFPGQNNRRQGWAIVRRALAHDDEESKPRLHIVRHACPNLIRELPALVRDPLDPEDTQQTVKGKEVSDHAVDALRYGLCTEALPAPPSAIRATFG